MHGVQHWSDVFERGMLKYNVRLGLKLLLQLPYLPKLFKRMWELLIRIKHLQRQHLHGVQHWFDVFERGMLKYNVRLGLKLLLQLPYLPKLFKRMWELLIRIKYLQRQHLHGVQHRLLDV